MDSIFSIACLKPPFTYTRFRNNFWNPGVQCGRSNCYQIHKCISEGYSKHDEKHYCLDYWSYNYANIWTNVSQSEMVKNSSKYHHFADCRFHFYGFRQFCLQWNNKTSQKTIKLVKLASKFIK